MNLWRRKLRLAAVAAVAAVALIAAGLQFQRQQQLSEQSGRPPVKGGTATVALPAGVTYNWIFPFYAITNASVYNAEQFQWLLYRPLYMFGNNTAARWPSTTRCRPPTRRRTATAARPSRST